MCSSRSLKLIAHAIIIMSLPLFAGNAYAKQKVASLPLTAATCIGEIKVHIVAPTSTKFRWRAALNLSSEQRVTGYFTHQANAAINKGKKLEKTFPSFNAKLIQKGKDTFVLKKRERPDCEIEIIEYGVLAPDSKSGNLYGLLVVPMILVVDEETNETDEYTWGNTTPEVESENWAWDVLMHPVDSFNKITEVIGGYNNVWENPNQQDDTPDPSDDKDEDGAADGDYNGDGVVSPAEELRWLRDSIVSWYNQGGILGWF